MNPHLGPRVSALADGQLPPAEREQALAHVAGCRVCAEQLAAERAARQALADAGAVAPSDDLTARLLSVASAAPAPSGRPVLRRVALLAASAAAIAVVAVGSLVALGSTAGPRADPYAMLGTVSTGAGSSPEPLRAADGAPPSTEEVLAWMRAEGWVAPESLPPGLRVVGVEVHDGDDGQVLELELAGATGRVRLVEQRGHLEVATATAVHTLGSHEAQMLSSGTAHVAVQSAGTVVMVAAAPDDGPVGELLLRSLPAGADDSFSARLRRGWDVVTGRLGLDVPSEEDAGEDVPHD